jgi:hypothetical protein
MNYSCNEEERVVWAGTDDVGKDKLNILHSVFILHRDSNGTFFYLESPRSLAIIAAAMGWKNDLCLMNVSRASSAPFLALYNDLRMFGKFAIWVREIYQKL